MMLNFFASAASASFLFDLPRGRYDCSSPSTKGLHGCSSSSTKELHDPDIGGKCVLMSSVAYSLLAFIQMGKKCPIRSCGIANPCAMTQNNSSVNMNETNEVF